MKEMYDSPAHEAGTASADEHHPKAKAAKLKDKPPVTESDRGPKKHQAAEAEPKAQKDHKVKKSKKGAKKRAEEEAIGIRLLRLQADFDNFRKRTLREKKDLYTRANEEIMQEVLPVLDHMELALTAAREHKAPQALLAGFTLVYEQLLTALKKFNLSIIDAEGSDFDFNQHEAISHISSPEIAEGGIITQVRKGYMLGDQLLRPAQVVVSKGPPEEANSSGQPANQDVTEG